MSDSGEFGLIGKLTRIVDEGGAGHLSRSDVVIGIGDDAAAWQTSDLLQLATTDMLVQDVHFTLETISWYDLGWKSLAVNISDIAAMGGLPTYALLSLGLPTGMEVESIAELYRGMTEIACQFNMAIIGGNLTEAPVFIINPTVIGAVAWDKVLRRSGASPGDQIAVTGHLGASAAGLKMLQEKCVFDSQITAVLRQAHLRPVPRVAEGQKLAQHGVKAAIDISDGLIADLGHICEASRVGASVRLQAVPVHPAVQEAFGARALGLALSGGEDYELLFTAPEVVMRDLMRSVVQMKVIGEIESSHPGKVMLLDEKGKETSLSKGGWEHFGKRS